MKKLKKVLLGSVGVDAGQLLICDPCYIDSEWEHEDFEDIRIHEHKITKDRLQYKKDFSNYMEIIPKYGKHMNDLNLTGEWINVASPPAKHNFSYNACCVATLSKECYGQLNYKLGHPGVGVVFSSGYGDGIYEVWGYFNHDGRCVKVEVLMDSEEVFNKITSQPKS